MRPLAFLAATLALLAMSMVKADTFTVNLLTDSTLAVDANPGDGICANSSGDCTLRAAIEEANATSGIDKIQFSRTGRIIISNDIVPSGPLPEITDTVEIIGPIAPDSPEIRDIPIPGIILDGRFVPDDGSAHGLTLESSASGSFLSTLAIIDFPGDGIRINNADSIDLSGLIIGLDPTTNEAAGNAGAGLAGVSTLTRVGKYAFGNPVIAIVGNGNVISANGQGGIVLLGSDNQFNGNYIGLGIDGILDRGNAGDGINIFGSSLTIGLSEYENTGNLISFNTKNGLVIGGDNANITNNHIGLNANLTPAGNDEAGVKLLGDQHILGTFAEFGENTIADNKFGVQVGSDSAPGNDIVIMNNWIGPADSDAGTQIEGVRVTNGTDNIILSNRILGNAATGIRIQGDAVGTEVQGNQIGLVTGTGEPQGFGNEIGLLDTGQNTKIGGDSGPDGNIVGYNIQSGIILGSSGSIVQGNFIGTTPSGRWTPNGLSGIFIAETGNFNIIGGEFGSNYISGNRQSGLFITGSFNLVSHNWIGVSPTGEPLGNILAGISIDAPGGANTILKNTIAYNQYDGVKIEGETAGNTIRLNTMFNNLTEGIDLGNDGFSVNDDGDGDAGPNKMLNYPEITILGYDMSTQNLMLDVFVDTPASEAIYPLAIDLYWHDRNESNQGRQHLGTYSYETPQSIMPISITFPPKTTGGTLRATTTDNSINGSTSELSPVKVFGFIDFIFSDSFERKAMP